MDKLPHQAGGARLVFAVQLTCPAAALADHECATAAWADTGYGTPTALCLILRNLGNDHIGLIHTDGVPRPQSQPCEVVQVVELGMIDCITINDHIIENTGQADHPRAGSCNLQMAELGFIPGIRPFEGDHSVLMVTSGAQ